MLSLDGLISCDGNILFLRLFKLFSTLGVVTPRRGVYVLFSALRSQSRQSQLIQPLAAN